MFRDSFHNVKATQSFGSHYETPSENATPMIRKTNNNPRSNTHDDVPMNVPIIDTPNILGKVFPSMTTVSIVFLINLFTNAPQIVSGGGRRRGGSSPVKGFCLWQLPGLAQNLGHATQGLLSFFFLFGIRLLTTSHCCVSVCVCVCVCMVRWNCRDSSSRWTEWQRGRAMCEPGVPR